MRTLFDDRAAKLFFLFVLFFCQLFGAAQDTGSLILWVALGVLAGLGFLYSGGNK